MLCNFEFVNTSHDNFGIFECPECFSHSKDYSIERNFLLLSCVILLQDCFALVLFCFAFSFWRLFFFFGLQEAIKNVLHSVQYNDQKQEYGLGALSGCDAITDMSYHGEVSLFRKKKTKRQLRFTCLCPSFAGDTLDQSRTPFKLPTTCAVTLATGTLPELTCARISSVSDQCVHPTVLQRVEQVQFNKCMCVSTTIHG